MILRTFSKAYGLAGARVGYALGDPRLIAGIARVAVPFGVSVPAQAAALALLRPGGAAVARGAHRGRRLRRANASRRISDAAAGTWLRAGRTSCSLTSRSQRTAQALQAPRDPGALGGWGRAHDNRDPRRERARAGSAGVFGSRSVSRLPTPRARCPSQVIRVGIGARSCAVRRLAADDVRLGDGFEALHAEFAAIAGLLRPAERDHRVQRAVRVDPCGAGLQACRRPRGPSLGHSTTPEEPRPTSSSSGEAHGLIKIRVPDNRQRRPELLLQTELLVGIDIGDQRSRVEVADGVAIGVAAEHDACARGLRGLDQAIHDVEL